MKDTLLRKTQRMFLRRKWLLFIILLPLLVPVQTVKPYYKAQLKIRLNPPEQLASHAERMNWLSEQAAALSGEKFLAEVLKDAGFNAGDLDKQLTFIKNNLEIYVETDNTISLELIAPDKQHLKEIANKIAVVYFDAANKERKNAVEEIYNSKQRELEALENKIKIVKADSDASKNIFDTFESSKTANDTKQIKSDIEQLKSKLAALKALYTEEHPQVKEAAAQIAEKTYVLNTKESQMAAELKKETDLANDYQKKQRDFDKLSQEISNAKASLQRQDAGDEAGAIVSMPKLADVGVIETKLLDLTNKLLAGLLIVFLIGLIAENFDKTIWNEIEIKRDLNIKTLGTAVKTKRRSQGGLLLEYPKDSAFVKSMETIRSNIQFINLASTLKVILYSSLLKSDNDLLAANLAISMTYIGGKIGLINITDKPQKYSDAILGVQNLKIIETGKPDMSDKQKAIDFIAPLKEKFDVIIIDSPPITDSTAAVALSFAADGIILGARIRKTEREFIFRNYKMLNEINSRVLGAILQW